MSRQTLLRLSMQSKRNVVTLEMIVATIMKWSQLNFVATFQSLSQQLGGKGL